MSEEDEWEREWEHRAKPDGVGVAALEQAPLLPTTANAVTHTRPGDDIQPFSSHWQHFAIISFLVVITVADVVLVIVLFDRFDEPYAQYINQGTAFVYCISSSLYLLVRWVVKRCSSKREGNLGDYDYDSLRSVPIAGEELGIQSGLDILNPKPVAKWYALLTIGLFNGTANVCMAMAQPHTPGLTQTLLYLLAIPLVLLISFLALKKKPSAIGVGAAGFILLGTALSAMRSVPVISGDRSAADSGGIVVLWYSVALFALGQVFLAGEKVFEEHIFRATRTDVMSMFCWTMWTQFLLGFALYPLQTLAPFGGLQLDKLPVVIRGGVLCTFGITSNLQHDVGPDTTLVECSSFNTMIFFVYCAVDFTCYGFGLYVINKGGANLMVIASSIALPVEQLVLCLPFMGSYKEKFFWGDAVAFVLVFVGFIVYQLLSPEGKRSRGIDPYPGRTNQPSSFKFWKQ